MTTDPLSTTELDPETYLVQGLRVKPEFALSDLFALFLCDSDLGLRFARTGEHGHDVRLEILWQHKGSMEINIGVPRGPRVDPFSAWMGQGLSQDPDGTDRTADVTNPCSEHK